ncbi:MAG: hypothetical protein DWQ41_08620 [Planctomycetota bacterium]|nr:MAG: hypothetical protein DWQ41_08620 [Planctomycetota bacterium]
MAARNAPPRGFPVVACEKTGNHFRGVQLTTKVGTKTRARNCQTCTEEFRFDVRLPWFQIPDTIFNKIVSWRLPTVVETEVLACLNHEVEKHPGEFLMTVIAPVRMGMYSFLCKNGDR